MTALLLILTHGYRKQTILATATWFRQLQAMKTVSSADIGLSLTSLLNSGLPCVATGRDSFGVNPGECGVRNRQHSHSRSDEHHADRQLASEQKQTRGTSSCPQRCIGRDALLVSGLWMACMARMNAQQGNPFIRNALCPEGANGPVWDDSIWNAMMSMNPETLA